MPEAARARPDAPAAQAAANRHDVCRLEVALGARSYPILIGSRLLDQAGPAVLEALPRLRRAVVVTDETVAALYLPRLTASLAASGIATCAVSVPAGEASKSFAMLERVCLAALDFGIDRGAAVIALGGGVVGDLAGFAASILLRGIPFVQIPTTLLAQVDSAVGGKTAIDCEAGKNLVGAFHQPRLVLADMDSLTSLPPRQMRAGYAEVVKYGLIDRPEFFAWCEANGAALLAGDAACLAEAVHVSCAAKAAIVARDETETGPRALLNLGHTFAHALELEAGMDGRLLHGEAVAIGLCMAFDFSVALGLCPAEDAKRVRRHLAASGLPVAPAALGLALDAERLMAAIGRDKKVKDGRATFILARGIGASFIHHGIDADSARRFIAGALREGA